MTVGRWLVDRKAPPMPRQRHHGLAADERADTDVFAAVTANGASENTDAETTTPVDYPDQPKQ